MLYPSGGTQLFPPLLFRPSDHSRDALLQNIIDPWPRTAGDGEDTSYIYPVLQPLDGSVGGKEPKAKGAAGKQGYLPWARCDSFVKFTLFGDNPLSSFMESAWGQVRVPIRDLVSATADKVGGLQPEVSGWYRVSLTGGLSSSVTTQVF